MGKRKQSNASWLRGYLNSFDLFTIDVSFRENGQDSFSTNIGLLISVVIIGIVCLYGNAKLNTFLERGETRHQTSTEEIVREKKSVDYAESKFDPGVLSIVFTPFKVDGKTYTYKNYNDLFDLAILETDGKEQIYKSGFHECGGEDLKAELGEDIPNDIEWKMYDSCFFNGVCMCPDSKNDLTIYE